MEEESKKLLEYRIANSHASKDQLHFYLGDESIEVSGVSRN